MGSEEAAAAMIMMMMIVMIGREMYLDGYWVYSLVILCGCYLHAYHKHEAEQTLVGHDSVNSVVLFTILSIIHEVPLISQGR